MNQPDNSNNEGNNPELPVKSNSWEEVSKKLNDNYLYDKKKQFC